MASPAVTAPPKSYQGTDKLLFGLVLAVVTFWLFAGTAGTVAPAILEDIGTQHVDVAAMNLAVSITALFSGLFIVLMGGLADRLGRVKITLLGVVLGMVGSLMLIFAAGSLALPLLLTGRAVQGFSAACVMPASLSLVKSYWDGAGRQRAVSMWSIGSWGGAGLAAVFGGAMTQFFTWRAIFVASIVVSAISFAMIVGTPESRVDRSGPRKAFDIVGLALFIVGTLSLMIILLFGSKLGWRSATVLTLAAVTIVAWAAFYFIERNKEHAFIDFALFENTTFTGATISNFLLNGTIGMLFISQQLIQLAGRKPDGSPYTAWDAGILTIGYGIFIIAFIRVGEKLLQRFGPRKPMIWGSLIVIVSCLLLMSTNLLIGQYVVLAVIAYCLFGLGLAFYATPSTDAALANLPAEQAGSGAGIYKMASSLGGAIGAAISLALFTGLSTSPITLIGDVVRVQGRTDNAALRLAAMVAIGANLAFVLLAIVIITLMVPKQSGRISPRPQLPPDAIRAAGLAECPLCHGEGVVNEDVARTKMPGPREQPPPGVIADEGVTT